MADEQTTADDVWISLTPRQIELLLWQHLIDMGGEIEVYVPDDKPNRKVAFMRNCKVAFMRYEGRIVAVAEGEEMPSDSQPTTAPDIRRNDDGTLDEIVAIGCDFHLEQMDDGYWWMSIRAGGIDTHVTLYTQRSAKIMANVIPHAG